MENNIEAVFKNANIMGGRGRFITDPQEVEELDSMIASAKKLAIEPGSENKHLNPSYIQLTSPRHFDLSNDLKLENL